MKAPEHRTIWLNIVLLAFLLVGPFQNFAAAEAVSFGVPLPTQEGPVSPEEEALTQAAAESATPEITELARALQHDPKQIFEYVRNHINYLPYFGSLKGATLTYLDGSGNDFDQASLMIALLRASGYTAQYVHGQMLIPDQDTADNQDMQHWLSVDANSSIVAQVLGNGGIPATYSSPNWLVDRVWVEATIDGATYALDPAFKIYEETLGGNPQVAMEYNHAALSQTAGGTVGTDYVQNLNKAGLKTSLDGYSPNLLDYIRSNYPNAQLEEEIVGEKKIIPEYLDQLPTDLNSSYTPQDYWTEIPDTYAHIIRIKDGRIDETFNIADLAGKRLSPTDRDANQGAATKVASASTSPAADQIPFAGGMVAKPANATQTQGVAASNSSPKFSSFAVKAAAATPNFNFGKIYPTGYVEGTMNLKNTNTKTIKLVVSLIKNTKGAYSLVKGGGTHNVKAGKTYPIKVRFKGTGQKPGTKTAKLRVQWYSGTTRFADKYTNLTGVVAYPLTLGGNGMNVRTFLNEPYTATCRLQNKGSKALTIASAVSRTGTNPARFNIVSGGGPGTIAPGGYRDIQAKYLANAHASHTANLHFALTYDGLSYTTDLPLQGKAVYKPALAGSYGLNFEQGYLNDAKDGAVRFKNSGAYTLTITGITLAGMDAGRFGIVSGNSAGELTAGQFRDIDIHYLANAVGIHSANIHVAYTYDGIAYTQDLGLNGETLAIPVGQFRFNALPIVGATDLVTTPDLGAMRLSIDHPYSGS